MTTPDDTQAKMELKFEIQSRIIVTSNSALSLDVYRQLLSRVYISSMRINDPKKKRKIASAGTELKSVNLCVPTSLYVHFMNLGFRLVKLNTKCNINPRVCSHVLSSCLDALQVHEHTDIDTASTSCG